MYGRYSQPYSLGGSSDVASGYQYCSNLLLLLRQWRHEGVCRPGGKRLCCRHSKSDWQLIFLFHVMQIPAESVSTLGVLNNYALYKSTHSLTHSLTHSEMQTPICQTWPIFRIPYLRPRKCRPQHTASWRKSPPSHRHCIMYSMPRMKPAQSFRAVHRPLQACTAKQTDNITA